MFRSNGTERLRRLTCCALREILISVMLLVVAIYFF